MKLRTKFLLSLLLVTTGLTGASLFIVRRSVRLHAREELSREPENSAATLRDFRARRERAAERSAELLADVPLLKAMMVTRDPATIQDASADIWRTQPGWWSVDRRLYQIFYHSIDSGSSSERNSVGLLVVGYELSPLLAQQISNIADGQVAFRTRGRIVASTLRERAGRR